MEILIVGGILVALMVYASTKLKRFTAEAFEAETVETDEFVVDKPDGFLHVIGGDRAYAFEAYSREFGGPGSEEIRQATAMLRIDTRRTVEHILQDRLGKDASVISDDNEMVNEMRYRVVIADVTKDGSAARVYHKIAESGGKVYDFEVRALSETTETITRNIETMIDSFAIK